MAQLSSQIFLCPGAATPQAGANDAQSRVVGLPEILRELFQHCEAPALASCARVCKTWNVHSVPLIWENIDAQQAIFGPLRWNSEAIGRPTFENLSLLSRIFSYTKWTKHLHIRIRKGTDLEYNTMKEFILAASLFRRPHFPRLTELIYEADDSLVLKTLLYWLSPRLLKLDLRVTILCPNPSTDLILQTLHEHAPHLVSLRLNLPFGASINPLSDNLSSSIHGLTHLEGFRAKWSLVFEPGVWKTLASLPNLKSMEIFWSSENEDHPIWEKALLPWDVDDPFPTLENIDGVIFTYLVPQVFGVRGMCNLRHIKLTAVDVPSELTIQTIFQTIPTYYSQLETFSVSVHHWEFPRHDLSTFLSKNLKTFSLVTATPIVITPDAFVAFIQHHPGLLSLTLAHQHRQCPDTASLTFDILPHVLEACPSLRELRISLQGQPYSMSLRREKIQKLCVVKGLQLNVKDAKAEESAALQEG
ncbi:uncharacterized protein EI90DRAFT_3292882 [Cantharellus anzutake]|uniref:uncharacterized protein n=1 Tax=Cantharellus anzutake TaxID=1750568 RepID=UPI001906F006|nr:uncharacterized protein EI90DRAFT_3292882 [Cantharellus anzutake]KAF8320598.1 hypothetical protein EI90DRAFT_3292882 [Cantharellus anzutake]